MIIKNFSDVSTEGKTKDEIELEFGSLWDLGARNFLKDNFA